jgi:hypothetical protein
MLFGNEKTGQTNPAPPLTSQRGRAGSKKQILFLFGN